MKIRELHSCLRESRVRFAYPLDPKERTVARPGNHAIDEMRLATPGMHIALDVNGETFSLMIEPRTSLLDVLRERLGITGPKKGCNQGACGACTVLADGERVLSCLALAAQYEGRQVTTVEGLAKDGGLHPLQRAFIDHDGFQCGYCTPGQLCSAIGMLNEVAGDLPSAVTSDMTAKVELSVEEIKERMSGNLCRCGAYVGICSAIHEVGSPAP